MTNPVTASAFIFYQTNSPIDDAGSLSHFNYQDVDISSILKGAYGSRKTTTASSKKTIAKKTKKTVTV